MTLDTDTDPNFARRLATLATDARVSQEGELARSVRRFLRVQLPLMEIAAAQGHMSYSLSILDLTQLFDLGPPEALRVHLEQECRAYGLCLSLRTSHPRSVTFSWARP